MGRPKSIHNYRAYGDLTKGQQRLFRNIYGVLSGGNSVFMQSADPNHQRKLGRAMAELSNMSNWKREQFFKENWIIFEEIFENSESVRNGGGNDEITTEEANAMIDAIFDRTFGFKRELKQTMLKSL